MKKINFGGKPSPRPGQGSSDDWVADRAMQPIEPTKRLTVDVPLSLHQRVKSQCAVRGEIMADVIRGLLEQQFSATLPLETAQRIDRSDSVADTIL